MDVNRKEALAAISRASKAVSKRPGIPALTGVKLDAFAGTIVATTTDLEVSCVTSFAGPGEYSALVPAKLMMDALKRSDRERVPFGPTSADLDAVSRGEVSAGPESSFEVGSAVLRQLPVDDFPGLQSPGDAVWIALHSYATAARAVSPACSRDEARPCLTGMLHEAHDGTLTLVGTDSYRLHTSELDAPGDYKTIIPERAIRTLLGFVGKRTEGRTIGIAVDDMQVTFTLDDGTILTTRIIEGEYPNWRQLMPCVPDHCNCGKTVTEHVPTGTLTIDPETFAGAILEVGQVARDTIPVRLSLNGTVELDVSSPDLGSAHVILTDASWNGDDMRVAFNPNYFAEAVRSVAATTLYVRDGLKPLMAYGPGGSALVMPVRLPAPVG